MWPICSSAVASSACAIVRQAPRASRPSRSRGRRAAAARRCTESRTSRGSVRLRSLHLFELCFRKRVEAEAALLAGGIRASSASPPGKLGMRAHQLRASLPATSRRHRSIAAVQILQRTKRPLVPRALRDPRRMLEHAAEPRHELAVFRASSPPRAPRTLVYTRRMLDPARIMERCDALARHSELPGGLTRVFLSPRGARRHRQACSAGCARPACRRSSTRSATPRRATKASAPGLALPDARLASRHGARRRHATTACSA